MDQSMQSKWQQIIKDVTSPHPPSTSDKGSLVVVGSGIMCVAHFTMETLNHIQDADKVFYLVTDPVTEIYIQELRPDAIDLFVLYDENKERATTYAQITDVLLHYTRRGQKVVVVFYGHPGYLVNPSHKAVQIARSEGLSALELPAISSLDTMISELGFEPGIPGLQVLEATDLLMYSRKLLTDIHVVINQVGCVGDVTFQYNGFPNQHLPVLIEYLISHYGESHVVYNYIGSQFPVCKSVVQKFKLIELLRPENAVNVQSMSTFYVPPLTTGKLNEEVARRIGMVRENTTQKVNHVDDAAKKSEKSKPSALFPGWSISRQYKPVKSSQLSKLLTKISKTSALDFTPEDEAALSEYQSKALRTRNSDWIHFALKSEEYEIKEAMRKPQNTEEKQGMINAVDGPPITNQALVIGCGPLDGQPITNKALVIGSDLVDSPPITNKALVIGCGPVDGAPITNKALVDACDLVDSPPITNKALVIGCGPVDGAPITNKALVIGSDLVDSPPITNKALVIGSDLVDSPPITNKPLVDASDLVDGPPITNKPLVIGCGPVDGPPITNKALVDACDLVDSPPITNKALVDASDLVDSPPITNKPLVIGCGPVDGPPITDKPTMNNNTL